VANEEHFERLKRGVAEWNAWCEEAPLVHRGRADLRGANLRPGRYFGNRAQFWLGLRVNTILPRSSVSTEPRLPGAFDPRTQPNNPARRRTPWRPSHPWSSVRTAFARPTCSRKFEFSFLNDNLMVPTAHRFIFSCVTVPRSH